jgi:hypothetical protein
MDIYKCPKMKTQKNFPQKFCKKKNKSNFLLKDSLNYFLKYIFKILKENASTNVK